MPSGAHAQYKYNYCADRWRWVDGRWWIALNLPCLVLRSIFLLPLKLLSRDSDTTRRSYLTMGQSKGCTSEIIPSTAYVWTGAYFLRHHKSSDTYGGKCIAFQGTTRNISGEGGGLETRADMSISIPSSSNGKRNFSAACLNLLPSRPRCAVVCRFNFTDGRQVMLLRRWLRQLWDSCWNFISQQAPVNWSTVQAIDWILPPEPANNCAHLLLTLFADGISWGILWGVKIGRA